VLRAGVAAGAAALLAGCGVRVGSRTGPATPVPPGADELARERVARDADALLALATRAAALRPADRALLAAVAADHRAHAAALRPAPPGSATPASPAASPPADGAPVTAAGALPTLVRAERAAAAAATAELDRVGGEVARLLASVAASRSLHVALVTARLGR
jgi:hypothetical protein